MGIGDIMILAAVFVWIAAVGCLMQRKRTGGSKGCGGHCDSCGVCCGRKQR